MNINTRNLGFVNFNNEEMQWIKFNGVTVYEAWEELIASGVPPLTLTKCKGVDLIDYKIYGNSTQNGTPTPETPIEVESVGDKTDNLYDIKSAVDNDILVYNGDNTYTFTKTSSSRFTKLVDMHIPANTPFTISVNILEYTGAFSNALGFQFQLEDGTLTGKAFFISSTIMTVTFTQAVKKIRLFLQANDEIGTFTKFKNVMINLGTTATDFEPYGYRMPVKVSNGTEEVTTNIYLDEPLRKIGDYADYIDFENKKFVRNIKEYVVTGDETWKVFTSNTEGYEIHQMYTQGLSFGGNNNISVYSNITPFGVTINDRQNFDLGCYLAASGNQLAFQLRGWTTTMTVNEWKEYLKANDVKVYYVLATPTKETIELPNIPTIKGTTIIEVDTEIQPSNMEVEYKGK